ncbi:MAG: tetratricopeptide repeat protein [Candidatus Acidiferrales bacterium]
MRKPRRRTSTARGEHRAGGARAVIERASALLLRGNGSAALRLLEPAVLRYPEDAEIVTRCGDALYLLEHVTEAREAYKRSLSADDAIFQAWYGLGCAEFSRGAYAAAIESFARAVALHGRDGDARMYLAKCLFYMGHVDEAIRECRAVAQGRDTESRRQALGEIAKIVPESPSLGNAEILKARVAWAKAEAKIERPAMKWRSREHARADSAGRKIRVGYVSAFFGSRNWMKPVWGVINEHERSRFEIVLFADREKPSLESGYRQHPADGLEDITGLTNEAAAKRIARAGIDVLVDLNWYSFASRLGMFMRKPAPVVCGWFGMYATTGVRAFDYIVADESALLRAEERFCTEHVLRVSGSYLAFRVLYPVPDVVAPPCVATGAITFGCFAPQYKITDEMIATWSRILSAVPTSRLILKDNCLDEESNRSAVFGRFAQFGVPQGRVTLEPPAEHYEFLKAYARVDIALDTFPYNGATTTTEALWQGVAVLTFNGDRWVSRTSRSLLRAAGLAEWVLGSRKGYVERAIELAKSPETPGKLAALRKVLREKVARSAACDTKALCAELEQHYKKIVRPSVASRAD